MKKKGQITLWIPDPLKPLPTNGLQNCPLDRKQGLGGWAKRVGSVACREARQLSRRGEQDTQKLQGGC